MGVYRPFIFIDGGIDRCGKSRKGVFHMKNTFKVNAILRIAGIIAFVAVIGFSMAACGDDSGGTTIPSELVDTWRYNGQVVFTIGADGKGTIGSQSGYTVTATYSKEQRNGNASFKQGSTETGQFTFSLNGNGHMWIQSGTGPFAAWANVGTGGGNWVIQRDHPWIVNYPGGGDGGQLPTAPAKPQ